MTTPAAPAAEYTDPIHHHHHHQECLRCLNCRHRRDLATSPLEVATKFRDKFEIFRDTGALVQKYFIGRLTKQ